MRKIDQERFEHTLRPPVWVKTPECYVPTKKPIKDWTDEELRRGLCPKSGGRVEACRECKSVCLYGFAMMGRVMEKQKEGTP